jgi:hypothetical protein
LPEHIEGLYFKHLKKSRPDCVRSIEQMVREYRRKKQELPADFQILLRSRPIDRSLETDEGNRQH